MKSIDISCEDSGSSSDTGACDIKGLNSDDEEEHKNEPTKNDLL